MTSNKLSSTDLLTRAVANVIPRPLAEEKLKSDQKLRIYWGIDPTTPKLHLGHTVPMRKLRAFADAGHRVILVIGSFTAMIGDPSDRDAERTPLTRDQVEANFQTYKEQAGKILDFSKIEVRYNHEWLEKLTFKEIAQLASNFTVQQMSERAMFAERMSKGKPVYLHEFLYPLMVGYDSVVLNVDCELGGTDQEFNMLCGRTLQQAFGKREKFVLTMHLIPGTDGRKMSKTYGNCVYLSDPPSEIFGKLMSLGDELIPLYMECCTDIPIEEVQQAKRTVKKGGKVMRDLKMRLARSIVTDMRGELAALRAEEEFQRMFAEKGLPDDLNALEQVRCGTPLIEILVRVKFAASKGEARRLIRQGGVRLNDITVTSIDTQVNEEALLKVGKRKFLKLKVSQRGE